MKYPKIQTLWKRDKDNKFVIMPGEYSDEFFEHYDRWVVSEKIHGMNVRVFYDMFNDDSDMVRFGGRTDNAQLPVFLYDKLHKLFTAEKLREVLNPDNKRYKAVLFGEGYGRKIQRGGDRYIKDGVNFALFDVYIYDASETRSVKGWWLTRDAIKDIADKLEISQVAEFPGILTKADIIDLIKQPIPSAIAEDKTHIAEGIVARVDPPVLFRNGHPVMFKLKVEDYTKLQAHSS